MAQLLAQILVVTVCARIAGAAARRIGQPAVVGEIAAGILLGPSLFGWLAPSLSALIFPPESLGTLKLLSEVGIVVFMFLMGLELDPAGLRKRARAAVLVSNAGVLVPFGLGLAAARVLYEGFAPASVSYLHFSLFIGVAMSITAFPVLARILEERSLTRTTLGSVALACAAVDDATAWTLLAILTALVKSGSAAQGITTALLCIVFVGAMFFVVRPTLSKRFAASGDVSKDVFTLTLLAFGCALLTDLIGVHALFGAFVAGVAAPVPPSLREAAKERLGGFASTLLVPLFFAFTGLRTDLALLAGAGVGSALVLILAAAVAGKLGGVTAGARLTGMSWHDSLALGTLMNTRGLMELIVLNIGYDLGILDGRLFAAMVVMAFVTTLATGPALTFLDAVFERKGAALPRGAAAGH